MSMRDEAEVEVKRWKAVTFSVFLSDPGLSFNVHLSAENPRCYLVVATLAHS